MEISVWSESELCLVFKRVSASLKIVGLFLAFLVVSRLWLYLKLSSCCLKSAAEGEMISELPSRFSVWIDGFFFPKVLRERSGSADFPFLRVTDLFILPGFLDAGGLGLGWPKA